MAINKHKTKTKVSKQVKSTDKKTQSAARSMSISHYDYTGEKKTKVALPKSVFGKKVHPQLLAQALRVYQTNQHTGTAYTKTRGEVSGSTHKIYRQKGTGRARHGDIRAPIFVGGGTVFGPRRKQAKRLTLPKKMRQMAMQAVLTQKAKDHKIIVLSGLDKASGKTKDMYQLFKKLDLLDKRLLLVIDADMKNAIRAVRNLEKVTICTSDNLSTLEIVKCGFLLLTKNTLADLDKRYEIGSKKTV